MFYEDDVCNAPNSTIPVASAAIKSFQEHLKYVYSNSPISPGSKWPSTPSKKYISLTVVKGRKCRDEYIGFTLQGNVSSVLENREKISIEQILQPEEGDKTLRLVLTEGAPGIGKSTLAYELCRKWDEYPCLKKHALVILLRLREEEVQAITDISTLFGLHADAGVDGKTLSREVSESHGSGVLFILDGFDELPKKLQQKGFLLNLIKGLVLPRSTVLVTSRPSATGELLINCRPQIGKHVEILGFTQANVESYASSIFSDNPTKLKRFMTYISASSNPAINSLMYVPLNAAIIVEIYDGCSSEELLPHTLTELYTELCLTILNRYLHPSMVRKFEDLPPELHDQFVFLSKLAFEGVENDKVIFDSVTLENNFGFLDSVSALYGGGKTSYNFLHLTVQEFFAAYYIKTLGIKGRDLFQKYGKVQRWNVVWRFVAGLTKFKEYEHLYSCQINFLELKSNPLQSITQLSLLYCNLTNADMIHLSDLIPSLPELKSLSVHHNRLTDGLQDGFYRVLQQLCDSSVTELHIANTGLGELLGSSHDYSSVLKRLMHSVTGKIKVLGIGHRGFVDTNDDKVAELLSGPSSLKALGLYFDDLSPHVHHLKNNSGLSAFGLFFNDPLPHVHGLVDIIQSNTSIQHLGFFIYMEFNSVSFDSIKLLVSAIQKNLILIQVGFFVVGIGDNDEAVINYMSCHHNELTKSDPRIIWKRNGMNPHLFEPLRD